MVTAPLAPPTPPPFVVLALPPEVLMNPLTDMTPVTDELAVSSDVSRSTAPPAPPAPVPLVPPPIAVMFEPIVMYCGAFTVIAPALPASDEELASEMLVALVLMPPVTLTVLNVLRSLPVLS